VSKPRDKPWRGTLKYDLARGDFLRFVVNSDTFCGRKTIVNLGLTLGKAAHQGMAYLGPRASARSRHAVRNRQPALVVLCGGRRSLPVRQHAPRLRGPRPPRLGPLGHGRHRVDLKGQGPGSWAPNPAQNKPADRYEETEMCAVGMKPSDREQRRPTIYNLVDCLSGGTAWDLLLRRETQPTISRTVVAPPSSVVE